MADTWTMDDEVALKQLALHGSRLVCLSAGGLPCGRSRGVSERRGATLDNNVAHRKKSGAAGGLGKSDSRLCPFSLFRPLHAMVRPCSDVVFLPDPPHESSSLSFALFNLIILSAVLSFC